MLALDLQIGSAELLRSLSWMKLEHIAADDFGELATEGLLVAAVHIGVAQPRVLDPGHGRRVPEELIPAEASQDVNDQAAVPGRLPAVPAGGQKAVDGLNDRLPHEPIG